VEPYRNGVSPHSPEVKSYVSRWASLRVKDGVVYRKYESPAGSVLFYQFLAPKSVREELLEMVSAGAAGHLASQADLSLAGGRSPSEVADVLLDVAPRRRPSPAFSDHQQTTF